MKKERFEIIYNDENGNIKAEYFYNYGEASDRAFHIKRYVSLYCLFIKQEKKLLNNWQIVFICVE